VADDGRADAVLTIFANVEESGAFRGADPFVAVAGVIGGAEFLQVERDHPGGVGAIHQHGNAAVFQFGNDALEWEDESGLAGDVIEQGDPGAGSDASEDWFDGLVFVSERKRDGRNDYFCAGLPGDVIDDISAGVVLVIGDQDFIAVFEGEGTKDGVHAGGGVCDEGEVGGFCAEEPGQGSSSLVEKRFEFADHEGDRFALQFATERMLVFENRFGAGAEGTVVQEGDLWIEPPVAGAGGWFTEGERLGGWRRRWC